MKVLLVEPPTVTAQATNGSRQVHPLGLGYLAAALRPDHDVVQLIPDVRPNPEGRNRMREAAAAIRDAAPDLVGISALSTTLPAARCLAALCREDLGPDVPLVLGGLHCTIMPESVEGFDHVVTGEGEETLPELVAAIEQGRDASAIPGVVGSGRPRAPVANLDLLPFPHREDLLWEENIQSAFYQSIITIRGCPYRCEYCSIPSLDGRRVRFRSPENVAQEIAFLLERYSISYLFFHDSVFTLSRKRTLALSQLLVDRGLTVPYTCQTRVDRVDEEVLDAMKAAGCEQIYFGIESGDDETLTKIRKNMPRERIRQTVQAVRSRGIRCCGFFMIGFPWETREHMERTADFATSLELDSLCLFSATPLPGSALFEMAGRPTLANDFDYRVPGRHANFTALPAAEYAGLYGEMWDRFDCYNLSRPH